MKLIAIIASSVVIFSAPFAGACEDESGSAHNSAEAEKASRSIASVSDSSCNFNCSDNSASKSDLAACLRLQERCEKNAAKKVGQK